MNRVRNINSACSLSAFEPPSAYPLWDGHESVTDYAKRLNVPPSQSLGPGGGVGGVKLELVLIPAGKNSQVLHFNFRYGARKKRLE